MLDGDDLVSFIDDEPADERAAVVDKLHGLDAKPATPLRAVLAHLGAFGVATLRDGEHKPLVLLAISGEDGHAEELVGFAAHLTETHAGDTRRRTPGGAELLVGGLETNGLALLRQQQHVVVGRTDFSADELVVLVAEVDGNHAGLARRVVRGEGRLLDQALLRRQEQVRRVLVGAQPHHAGDLLVGKERQQPDDVATLRVTSALGELPRLDAVHAPEVGEEQQPLVVRRGEQVLDLVVGAQRRSAYALATALLGAVLVGAGALHIAAVGNGDDDVLVGNEILVREVALCGDDLRAALVAVLVDNLLQLDADDLTLTLLLSEDVLEIGDLRLERGKPVDRLLTLEGREPAQLHVQDGAGLHLVDIEQRHQAGAGIVGVRRAPNEGDDLVELVEGLHQAAVDVRLLLRILQLELGAPADDLHLVLDPKRDELVETQRAGHAVDDGQHVAAKRLLQRRVLIQIVEHDAGLRVALQHDHQAQAGTRRRVVADVRDAGELAAVDEVGDALRESVGVRHVRQLLHDEHLPAALVFLEIDDGTHHDGAAPGTVRVFDALTPDDQRSAWEVGAVDALHGRFQQLLAARLGMLERPLHRVAHLTQVVRGDVRRHTDGDTRRAVHQEVREAGGEHRRLLLPVVVVGHEIDGVLVDLTHHLGRERGHLALGVSHGRGLVVALRTEVALPRDEGVAHRPRLSQAHEGVVDRRVAVRVVQTHNLTDDARALVPAAVGAITAVPHGIEHATVHGLEAVAHVGQRTPDDHAHGVVKVRFLDFLFEVRRIDAAMAACLQLVVQGFYRSFFVCHSFFLRCPGSARRERCAE